MTHTYLEALQAWFADHCDGDWEHGYGIRISTLDNPGWRLSVSLAGTELQGRVFAPVSTEISDENWVRCWVSDDVFEGRGGSRNLLDMIRTFLDWAASSDAV